MLTPSLSGITAEDARRLSEGLRAAAARWSHPQIPCTSIEITVAEPARGRLARRDEINLVVFRSGPWCHNERCGRLTTYPIRAAAMTTTYTDPIGTVEEADIELNAGHFSWFDAADSAKPHTPIEEVLIHELGHALGFKDLCLSDAREPLKVCTEEEEASVMRPGSGSTTLTDYDVRLLCATYPRTRDYPVRGGTNPTTWLLALPVAVLALFHCLFRRR